VLNNGGNFYVRDKAPMHMHVFISTPLRQFPLSHMPPKKVLREQQQVPTPCAMSLRPQPSTAGPTLNLNLVATALIVLTTSIHILNRLNFVFLQAEKNTEQQTRSHRFRGSCGHVEKMRSCDGHDYGVQL
jgi:hypothetical protein